jgi:hypothetical protein
MIEVKLEVEGDKDVVREAVGEFIFALPSRSVVAHSAVIVHGPEFNRQREVVTVDREPDPKAQEGPAAKPKSKKAKK